MMSTIERDHEQGDELVVITKGAPDVLLATLHPGAGRHGRRRARPTRSRAADPGRRRPSSPETRCARWRWPTGRSSPGEELSRRETGAAT